GGPQGPTSIPKGVLKAPLLRSFESGDGRSRKIGVHPEEEELQLPVRDLKSHHDLVARRHVLMCRIADGCVYPLDRLLERVGIGDGGLAERLTEAEILHERGDA